MATIYKRKELRPIPEGATIKQYRGKPCAVWTDRHGKMQRAPLNAAGDRMVQVADNFTVQYFDADGKRRKAPTGTPDKATAERIAARIEDEVAQRKRGLIDRTQERVAEESRRLIDEHLADFQAAMQSAARTADHIRATIGFVRAIADAAKWQTLADIDADGVNTYAADLLAQGLAARTVQARLTAAKSFTRWLVKHGKLAADPLAAVAKPSPAKDRRHERRMLLHEEWEWLRVTTANGPERCGMTGRERMLLYAVAIQSGLRSSECSSLTRGRLFLDGAQPYIICKARTTKNAKDCKQYITPDLAAELVKHIATKAPAARVFNMPKKWDVAPMFRADLADARAAWLKAAQGPKEHLRRQQSDFLAYTNHEGKRQTSTAYGILAGHGLHWQGSTRK